MQADAYAGFGYLRPDELTGDEITRELITQKCYRSSEPLEA